jgi:hypothetical protein
MKNLITLLREITKICGYEVVLAYTYHAEKKAFQKQYLKIVPEGETFFSDSVKSSIGKNSSN